MVHIQSSTELEHYCRTNLAYMEGSVRKILIVFQGLNRHDYIVQPTDPEELEWAHKGVLTILPYTQPWSWMNEDTVSYMNWLLSEIKTLLKLAEDVPVISTGFSMGGLEALIYPIYASHKIAAVVANSPVCDLVYHFTERPDLPRTLLSAFIGYRDGFEAGLESRSPLHQVARMKRIPYMVISGGMDDQVSEKKHAIPFVEKMKEQQYDICHLSSPGMRHWAIDSYSIYKQMVDFIDGGYMQKQD